MWGLSDESVTEHFGVDCGFLHEEKHLDLFLFGSFDVQIEWSVIDFP